MTEQQVVDITELAVLGEQFPLRLMQLGFRLIQVIDVMGHDRFRYVLPPVCAVPAGPFLMGSDKRQDEQARDDELPQHTVTLGAYHIGTYPLTVTEYACFLLATQYEEPEEWSDMQQRPDHPMWRATWEDALAYVRWLTQVTSDDWRLPTEAEWEKAARGTDGRIFPWGNQWDGQRANSRDGGAMAPTPVGNYPSGASPYGCYDMAGNVGEWTSTTYQPYPYQATDGREDLNNPTNKVLRGGSHTNVPQYARAAHRYTLYITFTTNIYGVRLVRGE